MGSPYKYQSSWKTEDLFTNYYTKSEIDTLLAELKIPIYATAPANPLDGWIYLNSLDYKIYIYYGGTWQVLHTLYMPVTITEGVPMGLLAALTYATLITSSPVAISDGMPMGLLTTLTYQT